MEAELSRTVQCGCAVGRMVYVDAGGKTISESALEK